LFGLVASSSRGRPFLRRPCRSILISPGERGPPNVTFFTGFDCPRLARRPYSAPTISCSCATAPGTWSRFSSVAFAGDRRLYEGGRGWPKPSERREPHGPPAVRSPRRSGALAELGASSSSTPPRAGAGLQLPAPPPPPGGPPREWPPGVHLRENPRASNGVRPRLRRNGGWSSPLGAREGTNALPSSARPNTRAQPGWPA